MAPKGGTLLLLLIVFSAALDICPDTKTRKNLYCEDSPKKLMRKCQEMGHPVPDETQVKQVFGNSAKEKTDDENSSAESTFMKLLKEVTNRDLNDSGKVGYEKLDFKELLRIVKQLKNSSEPSVCYMRAFVSCAALNNLTNQDENMDSSDYDQLQWAADPELRTIPPNRLQLGAQAKGPKMKRKMDILAKAYGHMSNNQKTQVLRWAKEQIMRDRFNCTTSSSKSTSIKKCKPSLKWLTADTFKMIGKFISRLDSADIESCPKEALCQFFQSPKFKTTFSNINKLNPTLCKTLLSKIQKCFNSSEAFAEHVDRLGPLACCYYDPPDMTSDLNKKLLTQLSSCKNPGLSKLKRQIIKSVMSNSTGANAETVRELGDSAVLLSPEQLSKVRNDDLKDILRDPKVRWRKEQHEVLLKKILGDEKCKEMSSRDMMNCISLVGELPKCIFQKVKVQDMLDKPEELKNITNRMKKWQEMAIVEKLRDKVDLSDVIRKLPPPLLRRIPLTYLSKLNSMDQVADKMWSRAQAAYYVEKMSQQRDFSLRNVGGLLPGVTCEMIRKLSDKETLALAQAMKENPDRLNKAQAAIAAFRYFRTLEKQRADYFKTITPDELDEISPEMLPYLPPRKVNDLPDAVCPVLLDKMEEVNLSSSPIYSPSRPALTQRALRCLTNGTDLSELTVEDVYRLGQFLCEIKPSELRLLSPDVLVSSLEAMDSCQHIPQKHRAPLVEIVIENFGAPSDWSPETVEKLGHIIRLNDTVVNDLPDKPGMAEVLKYVDDQPKNPESLKKKYFDLVIKESKGARKKRETNSNGNGNSGNNDGGSNTETGGNTVRDQTPTVELIERLGMNNVYWSMEQLKAISPEIFTATVQTLGSVPDYDHKKLAVLNRKAVQVWGPAAQMNESVVAQMGCIAQGFSDTELEELDFSLDTLDDIAHCNWNESQLVPVWKGIGTFNNWTAEQLEATDMVALNRFICGLNSSEIRQLNTSAFIDAVGAMDDMQCSFEVAQHFKSHAVSVFGAPSSWTAAQVSYLGNIIGGLNAREFASLKTPVLSFISPKSIPLILPKVLAVLTPAQIEALGPDNAAMLTNKQKDALGAEQRDALEIALKGVSETDGSYSGAPSLSVEGMSAFMKPLLFLLMGFMLL
ncbi:otoancorin [Sphaeramia orbicularis]|uniref:otoancorin n=1 Tax=Sphaeramia orbicularis TaxID=375764 RepID=UPI00117E1631|nr:otoancorin [Sphaeramia orbicularis]